MKHLEFTDIEFYADSIPEEEWTTEYLFRHEAITEHMMECDACCKKVTEYQMGLAQLQRDFMEGAALLEHEDDIRAQLRRLEAKKSAQLDWMTAAACRVLPAASMSAPMEEKKKKEDDGKIKL